MLPFCSCDVCVLVEGVRSVDGVIPCFHTHAAVADVDSGAPHRALTPSGQTCCAVCPIPLTAVGGFVVGVAVGGSADGGFGQFAATAVGEGVIHRGTFASGAAGERSSEIVVCVGAFDDAGVASFVTHADEQVTVGFVALRQRRVARHVLFLFCLFSFLTSLPVFHVV